MNHKKIILMGLITLLVFSGCGLKESVVEKQRVGYLSFTGDTADAVVFIDDLEPISLRSSDKAHYEISPGKHHIVIKKNGAEVVNRLILVGNGSTKEIRIP